MARTLIRCCLSLILLAGISFAQGSPVTGNETPSINVADKGYFISTGILAGSAVATGTAAVVTAGNDVRVAQFYLPIAMTVGKVTITVAANVGSSTVTVGIYDMNGNKLIDSGLFNGNSATTQTNTLSVPITLKAGIYFFAQSASTQTTLTTQTISTGNGVAPVLNNQTVKKYGTCANSASSGVLPATCGTITALAFPPVIAAFER